MNALAATWFEDEDRRDLRRWGIAAAVVVGVHLAAIAGYLYVHQPAEIGGKVAVGKVLGRAGSFSTSGCTENTDAREGVHKAEAFAIAPIPQHRLRVEFGQAFFVIGHSKNGRGWPVIPAR